MRGLRPQGADLRAAGRAAEAVVLRLRGGGEGRDGVPEEDVRGLRPQVAALRTAGRAVEAEGTVVRRLQEGPPRGCARQTVGIVSQEAGW